MPEIELHYTQAQLAVLLGNRSQRWVIEEIKAGQFGPDVVKDGQDYLVPASAVMRWREARRVFQSVDLEPIAARSEGELRRKAHLRRGAA